MQSLAAVLCVVSGVSTAVYLRAMFTYDGPEECSNFEDLCGYVSIGSHVALYSFVLGIAIFGV